MLPAKVRKDIEDNKSASVQTTFKRLLKSGHASLFLSFAVLTPIKKVGAEFATVTAVGSNGTIGTAALRVFEEDPISDESVLQDSKNVGGIYGGAVLNPSHILPVSAIRPNLHLASGIPFASSLPARPDQYDGPPVNIVLPITPRLGNHLKEQTAFSTEDEKLHGYPNPVQALGRIRVPATSKMFQVHLTGHKSDTPSSIKEVQSSTMAPFAFRRHHVVKGPNGDVIKTSTGTLDTSSHGFMVLKGGSDILKPEGLPISLRS